MGSGQISVACGAIQLRACALALLVGAILALAPYVRGNVEMRVMGPHLCPQDEAGIAEVRAAEQVAKDWCVLADAFLHTYRARLCSSRVPLSVLHNRNEGDPSA